MNKLIIAFISLFLSTNLNTASQIDCIVKLKMSVPNAKYLYHRDFTNVTQIFYTVNGKRRSLIF